MRFRRNALAVLLAGSVMMLQLPGCGGSGGGSGSSATASASTTLAGTAMAGPFLSGQACAYRVVNGAKGGLLGTCANLASSAFSIDIGSYTGDVLIEIGAGATYDDEADSTDNATGTTLTGTLRTLIHVGSAGGTTSLAVTPLTEAAVRMAATLDAAGVQAAITQLWSVLPTVSGLDLRSTVPVTGTSQGLAYREMLRALSNLQWVAGGNGAYAGGLDAYLTVLVGQIGSNGNTVVADLLTQLGNGLDSNCTVSNGALACTVSSGGGGGGGGGGGAGSITCDTSHFAPGAPIATPTNQQLATFARTYTGSEGSFDMNFNFTATGAATLVFNADGSATYNTSAYAPTSHCLETLPNNAGQQLVIHGPSNSHFDLRSDGSWNGLAPNGSVVNDTPYNGGGGAGNAGSFGALTITGNPGGINGASVPASFSPDAQGTHPSTIVSWSQGSGASIWYLALNGDVVTSVGSFGAWQLNAVLAGLETRGVAFDMPNGSITFTNVTLNASGASTGQMILNGTLNVPAATGSAVAITGTGTNAAGSGFDAPAATASSVLIGSVTKDIYIWDGGKGITIEVDNYSNGSKAVYVTNKAGPSWRNTSPGSMVTVDTGAKTVTFSSATLSGVSPTTSSLTLNGTLTLP